MYEFLFKIIMVQGLLVLFLNTCIIYQNARGLKYVLPGCESKSIDLASFESLLARKVFQGGERAAYDILGTLYCF